jgi:hypothetical protein
MLEPIKVTGGAGGNKYIDVADIPGTPGRVEFTVGTSNTNNINGSATYRAYITSVHDTGSTNVMIGPATAPPGDGSSAFLGQEVRV